MIVILFASVLIQGQSNAVVKFMSNCMLTVKVSSECLKKVQVYNQCGKFCLITGRCFLSLLIVNTIENIWCITSILHLSLEM